MADSTPAAEALTAATNPSTWAGVASATEALMVQWLQPLNVVLLIGIIMLVRFLHRANQRSDFDLVDALKGPDGKASMKLLGYVVALILGSWALMNCATNWQVQPAQFVEVFAIYMVVLVAPKIAAEWIQAKYRGGEREDDRKRDDERRPGN